MKSTKLIKKFIVHCSVFLTVISQPLIAAQFHLDTSFYTAKYSNKQKTKPMTIPVYIVGKPDNPVTELTVQCFSTQKRCTINNAQYKFSVANKKITVFHSGKVIEQFDGLSYQAFDDGYISGVKDRAHFIEVSAYHYLNTYFKPPKPEPASYSFDASIYTAELDESYVEGEPIIFPVVDEANTESVKPDLVFRCSVPSESCKVNNQRYKYRQSDKFIEILHKSNVIKRFKIIAIQPFPDLGYVPGIEDTQYFIEVIGHHYLNNYYKPAK